MTPSVCLAALSWSLPWLACEGVRRQGAAVVPEAPGVRVQSFSKSVAMAPGADGQMHAFVRETRSARVGEGLEAQAVTIVRECKEGECEERQIVGDRDVARNALGRGSLPRFFGDDGAEPVMGPLPAAFGLDVFDDDAFGGFGSLTSWIDGDGGSALARVAGVPGGLGALASWIDGGAPDSQAAAIPVVDSLTRVVEVREENGQRKTTEEITLCNAGECVTEVVHDGDIGGKTTWESKKMSP